MIQCGLLIQGGLLHLVWRRQLLRGMGGCACLLNLLLLMLWCRRHSSEELCWVNPVLHRWWRGERPVPVVSVPVAVVPIGIITIGSPPPAITKHFEESIAQTLRTPSPEP